MVGSQELGTRQLDVGKKKVAADTRREKPAGSRKKRDSSSGRGVIRGGRRRVGRPNRWEQVRSGEEGKEEIEGFRQAWRGADGAAVPGEAGVNILSSGQTSFAPEAGPDFGFGMLSADAQSRRQAGVSLPWGVGWMPDGASVLFTYLESLGWSLFWDCPPHLDESLF